MWKLTWLESVIIVNFALRDLKLPILCPNIFPIITDLKKYLLFRGLSIFRKKRFFALKIHENCLNIYGIYLFLRFK